MGVPQNGWFISYIRDNPVKMDDSGVRPPPIYGNPQISSQNANPNSIIAFPKSSD